VAGNADRDAVGKLVGCLVSAAVLVGELVTGTAVDAIGDVVGTNDGDAVANGAEVGSNDGAAVGTGTTGADVVGERVGGDVAAMYGATARPDA